MDNSIFNFGPMFNINRRRFLQSAAASTALAALPSLGAEALEIVGGRTRRVGLIGAGWYGPSDLWRLIQVAPVEVVALCDPDKNMLKSAVEIASQRQKSHAKPPTYNDYRQMLKEHEFDIVLVGSPDHWHALHAIAAIEAGADVYLQKPISVDVHEGEAILAAARKHRARRANRHAAQKYAALDRREKAGCRCGPVGESRPRGNVLLFPHASQRKSVGRAGARFSRLRNVDRAGAAAAL